MLDFLAQRVLVPVLLRLGLAVIFIFHGLLKVNAGTDWGTHWDPAGQLSVSVQLLVAYGELLGGVAIALGFLTRLAAVGIAALMVGAIYQVHGQHGFLLSTDQPGMLGYEYNFALIVLCLTLMIVGGGVLSLDRLLFSSSRDRGTTRKADVPQVGTPIQLRR